MRLKKSFFSFTLISFFAGVSSIFPVVFFIGFTFPIYDLRPYLHVTFSLVNTSLMITTKLLRQAPRLFFARSNLTLASARSVYDRIKTEDRAVGVYTEYGWVVLKHSHVARGWTAKEIEKAVDRELGARAKLADKYEIQQIAEKWEANVNLDEKPVHKKASPVETQVREERLLFMEQLREELSSGKFGKTSRNGLGSTDEVTAVQAWNYFVTKKYPEYKHLLKKEARAKVGLLWRKMYPEEKDVYKEEYRLLKALGKDILYGKIVDRETKDKANSRMRRAKALAAKKKKDANDHELEGALEQL